ncbi:MAG TPA: hypothetical protein PK978_00725 [Paludibacter sp.]|nr:hypothetical protein [Paludibacter sp.]
MIDYSIVIKRCLEYSQKNNMGIDGFSNQLIREANTANDNGIGNDEFFKGVENVVLTKIKGIENFCNERMTDIDKRIEYWQNFIEDDKEWEKEFKEKLKASGNVVTVTYYDREMHQEEKKINRDEKIQEYKDKRKNWDYSSPDFDYQQTMREYFGDERQYGNYQMLIKLKKWIEATKQKLLQAEQILLPTQTNATQQPPHFNGDYTDEELTATFNKLIQGEYIHSECDLDSFIYLCTGRTGKTFTKTVNWVKSGALFTQFVGVLFENEMNYWKKLKPFFTIDGKPLNIKSLANTKSKIANEYQALPKGYNELMEILKILKTK